MSETLAKSTWSAKDVHEQWAQGSLTLVDVREPDEFARERIDGGRLEPLGNLDSEKLRNLPRPIVVTCASGVRATEAAKRLTAAGIEDVHVLEGGLQGWKRAGFPIVREKGGLPIMRQVQIVAGSLVVVGTVLGAFVAPGWLALSGFVGAGLVFAGVTGFCGMANLLQMMPWNR